MRIKDDQTAMREKLAEIEAAILSLEANRRALEWSIRANLINALAYKQVTITGNGYDHEFDDIADDAILQEADELAQEAAELGEPYDQDDEPEETLAETMDYSQVPDYADDLPF